MEISPQEVGGAVKKWFVDVGKNILLVSAVVGVVSGFFGTVGVPIAGRMIGPYVDEWVEKRISSAIELSEENSAKERERLASALENIVTIVSNVDTKPLIQIQGSPILTDQTTVRAGESIPIGYFLRRNHACPTEIIVQFVSAKTNRIVTNLTYIIPATPARVSNDYGLFFVDVTIPEHTPPGFYSYQPRAIPSGDCKFPAPFTIRPSPFFEVTE